MSIGYMHDSRNSSTTRNKSKTRRGRNNKLKLERRGLNDPRLGHGNSPTELSQKLSRNIFWTAVVDHWHGRHKCTKHLAEINPIET